MSSPKCAVISATPMIDLTAYSATELARAIRNKELSALEVVESHLRRIEIVNSRLNAVVNLTSEAALKEARRADDALARGETWGALHGVPMTIKDNLDTAGVISTGGTKGRATFIPKEDATVVARLRGAGAILLGKTNTPELTMAYETDNLIHGRTNNPHNLALTSGGSSGGAAAIVAAGGSPFDIGSDTGGSIRVPCHFCGTVGLMPTAGRVPKEGHILPPGGFVDEMTMLGPIARNVCDLELVLSIISVADPSETRAIPLPIARSERVDSKGLRAAYLTDNGIMSSVPEIAMAVECVAAKLVEAGMSVEEACPSALSESLDLTLDLWTADGGAGFAKVLKASGTSEMHPFMQTVMDFCRQRPKSSADRLHMRWERFRDAMLQFMQHYDLLVSPVCPFEALPHGRTFDEDRFPGFSYTMTHNLTGWPVAVIRAGTTSDKLPIGVQLAGRPWREDVVLAAARFLEKAFGVWSRPMS
jgi:amidase